MKQYRPTIEQLKKRYSQEMARRKMIERRHARHPEFASRRPIPDNSEPWLPGGVRSVADALWISDRIQETAKEWNLPLPPQD